MDAYFSAIVYAIALTFTPTEPAFMPRWLRVTAAILMLGLLGVAGVLLYTGTPPMEITTLLASDAVVQLRPQMRAARPDGPRVLVIALDGVGAQEFRDALRAGGMPRVAALLGAELDREGGRLAHGLAPDSVWSILPSTTYAAWTSVYTGVGVSQHGVAGNEWFDRMSMTFVAPSPVSVKEHGDAVRVYSDSLLHEWIAVPTVFERADVRSYVTLAAQYRGADLLVRPDAGMFAKLATSFAAGVVEGESDHSTYSALDQAAVDHTLEAIAEHGLADLQVVYFPGVDLFTHVADSAITEQERYLSNVVDRAVGRLLDAYAARRALAQTYVLFVSDHGHTPALADDRHALGTGGEGEPADVLKKVGFRVRPFELEADDTNYQAVLAYQGALAYVHLADRSTCPAKENRCDWKAPPRFNEDILPAVRAFDAAGRSGVAASKLMGAIDLIFARESRGADTVGPFQVWDGNALVPVRTFLAANPRPDLIDLEQRLKTLAVGSFGHRSGDIMVLSRYREIDRLDDRYYFSSRYRSWHGSPSRQDSEILFALAHPSSTGEELGALVKGAFRTTPTQLDITPLILKLLKR